MVALSAAVASLVFLVPISASFTGQVRLVSVLGLLMATLWLTEAVPLALTALIPLAVFPLTGIATADAAARPYANSTVFLFLGGFLVAATVEKWGLHRRIAFGVLSAVGTEPRRLIFAVLLATAGLSMWMSNTATTLMMTPIAVALIRNLDSRNGDVVTDSAKRFGTATLLAVTYGASLGGIGTPIGTPTNIIFLGAAQQLVPDAPTITFAEWMVFGLAFLVFALPVCWLILITRNRIEKGAAIPLESLGISSGGPMTRPERTAALICFITATAWVFRADIALGAIRIPGWSNLLANPKGIHDATVAIVVAVVSFLIPVGGGRKLLEWSDFRRIPWDVLILFGGGFALADALESTGFSSWASEELSFVGKWPPVLMILVICLVVTALSEFASNVATATAMMPFAAALAVTIHVHPYLLMLPCVLAASAGFMLPVATAPNTIVYATGLVSVREMARNGLLLDLICAVIITAVVLLIVPHAIGVDLMTPLAAKVTP